MKISLKSVLNKFPKKRPKLSKPIKNIFDIEYRKNRTNYFSQLSESWLHYSIKGRSCNINCLTLEIGAGTLNHLKYECKKNLEDYSIIEPKKYLFKSNKLKNSVTNIYKSFDKLPKNKFDRIISCAVLEHLEDLPMYLVKTAVAMKKNGYQSHSIPCEGYPTWQVAWNVASAVPFKIRTGLDFKEIQKHEHLNNYDEIVLLIKHFYNKCEIKHSYPLFFSPFFSLYANITFSGPNYNSIKKYLRDKKKLYK